ncbi:Nucleoside triphosphate pyrophosphohydrolase [Hartmannibacter diazotrophicus]|uniref:Nucleoside triphosphate pyrophosphohydrolase n=1 Tax=Hartmannibacter diazotrophicus TaxID=1482074 RepID=A0A2C9D7Z7_9HYPH|nr:nucleoside triphosphate pyrophosphohydrolase [Hartmannibacter diazotrophicus]SON55871.1 Nucleoside triphosphate pyrophosphohydrolase [Hartmannibacter diazotrophicus]
MTNVPDGRDIADLIAVMAALRDPKTGCPWDIEQTFASIAPYTIEEAYEVADAIARGDIDDLRDELGDLLLQVVFHARMAEEAGDFAFPDVVKAIVDKMIRRHPHVFGDAEARDAGAVKGSWARIKAEEKAARQARRSARGLADDSDKGLLGDVPSAQPPLSRAVKLQARASTVGFDWNDPRLVIAKIREELDELEAEIDRHEGALTRHAPPPEAVSQELGDVLFAMANLARHIGADPDMALAMTNEKFVRRFRFIEEELKRRGRTLQEASLDEMETLWQRAKTERSEAAE